MALASLPLLYPLPDPDAGTVNTVPRAMRMGEFYGRVFRKLGSGGFLLTELAHACERALPEHSHESAYFSMMLEGEYCERVGSKELPYGLLTTAFHPPGMTHRDRVGKSGTRLFAVELDNKWLGCMQELLPRMELVPDLCSEQVKWLISRLYFLYCDSENCAPLAIEELSLEILATLARAKECKEIRRPKWLARAEEFLHAEIHRNVSLEEVATEADVHPVYLSRVFRRIHRQSIDSYVNHARVQRASETLCRDAMPLSEIAALHGFADQSHFTRIFKRITGSTPAAFRRALRGY